MDSQERELFEASVKAAFAGAEPDKALTALGWSEALEAAPGDAIAAVFLAQGEACATTGALHSVLALGSSADRLPLPGALVLGSVPEGWGVAETIGGLDPRAGLVRVEGAPAGEPAVALGQLALAFELVGVGRGMLDRAREHALSRVQFGTTISSFQAVRHRLAETYVALESAHSLAIAVSEEVGEAEASDGPAGVATGAAIAKAVAGRAARTASRHCQQVLAGIGFTTEHSFHTYLRRALLLDQLLGSTDQLTRELGASIRSSRALPELFAL